MLSERVVAVGLAGPLDDDGDKLWAPVLLMYVFATSIQENPGHVSQVWTDTLHTWLGGQRRHSGTIKNGHCTQVAVLLLRLLYVCCPFVVPLSGWCRFVNKTKGVLFGMIGMRTYI